MAGKENFKKDRFEERLLNELNGLLRKDISDSRLQFLTFTKVELNPDFSESIIYWDTFDASKRPSIEDGLKTVSGKFRSLLASRLNVRHTPTISFKYDSQFEAEKAITELLDNETKKDKSF